MISNPVTRYITGNDVVSFTYESGSKLFHFSPKTNKLSSDMRCNVVFFANDEDHARNVLKRMFLFNIQCAKKHLEYLINQPQCYEALLLYAYGSINKWQHYLDEIDNITITEAPTNQFYKVGWADNDTI